MCQHAVNKFLNTIDQSQNCITQSRSFVFYCNIVHNQAKYDTAFRVNVLRQIAMNSVIAHNQHGGGYKSIQYYAMIFLDDLV